MCGRVVILFVVAGLSLPVWPQCSWTPRVSVPFRTTAFDLALEHPWLWLATGYGIQLLEDDGTRIVDSLPLPGATRVVRLDPRGVAYVGSGSQLHVVQRSGRSLSTVRSIDAGAPINDILLAGSYLFVATTNGIAHIEAFNATDPSVLDVLTTSLPNVTSLATANGKLYAADGDTSVEIFSISIPSVPQRTGELTPTFRATSVHTGFNGNLFVSDAFGQSTDIFAGNTRVGTLPVGTNTFSAATGGLHFVAGPDRTVRAVDFSSTTILKELFEHRLAPAGGTDNVIHAMASAGTVLYVAAGDIGLAIFDIGSLSPPFPLASYRTAATSSTVVSGDLAWFGDGSGTISEQKIVPSGLSLQVQRSWQGGTAVQDVEGTELLTSGGATTTRWNLTPQTPAAGGITTFRSAVRTAAIHGSRVVALLEDGTVWTGNATPQQVSPLPRIAQLARSGTGILLLETRIDGKTILHYYPSGDFAAPPRQATIDGVIIGGMAFNGNQAAIFTFRGVNVVNLDTGVVRVVNDSARTLPRQLAFAGDDLLVVDNRILTVYDDAQVAVRETFLPADAVAMDTTGAIVVMATAEGTLAHSYLAEGPELEIPFSSRFYTKIVTAEDRVYLYAPDSIDIYTTGSSNQPRYVGGIFTGGIVDLTATAEGVFTLSAAGIVTAHTRWGTATHQVAMDEGADAQPLAIDSAGGALWVSFSKGCQSGQCQQVTRVLDPVSLVAAGSMTAGVMDVVSATNRAYTLTGLPAEIRVIDISDPLHPSVVNTAAAPPFATSIAAYPGRVYVLGDRLYEYPESTLVPGTGHLTSIVPDKVQQVRVAGDCLVISARTANPVTYHAATITPAPPFFEVPSPVRGIATQPSRLLLLTTHSLEVWSSVDSQPSKRRGGR